MTHMTLRLKIFQFGVKRFRNFLKIEHCKILRRAFYSGLTAATSPQNSVRCNDKCLCFIISALAGILLKSQNVYLFISVQFVARY